MARWDLDKSWAACSTDRFWEVPISMEVIVLKIPQSGQRKCWWGVFVVYLWYFIRSRHGSFNIVTSCEMQTWQLNKMWTLKLWIFELRRNLENTWCINVVFFCCTLLRRKVNWSIISCCTLYIKNSFKCLATKKNIQHGRRKIVILYLLFLAGTVKRRPTCRRKPSQISDSEDGRCLWSSTPPQKKKHWYHHDFPTVDGSITTWDV